MDTYEKVKTTMLIYAENGFPILDGLPHPDHTKLLEFMPWVLECKELFWGNEISKKSVKLAACVLCQEVYRGIYPQLCNNYTLSAFDLC